MTLSAALGSGLQKRFWRNYVPITTHNGRKLFIERKNPTLFLSPSPTGQAMESCGQSSGEQSAWRTRLIFIFFQCLFIDLYSETESKTWICVPPIHAFIGGFLPVS